MISKSSVNGENNDDIDDHSGIDEEEIILTTNKDVRQRNLVRENITPKQILNNYNKYFKNTNLKSFKQGNTLAYITPWNGKGYDIAVKFANKFSHLSPVWYQIKFENKYQIEGDHNVNKNWMEKVWDQSNKKTKIVPRFSFEGQGWSKLESFQKSFKDPKFIDSLILVIKNNNYDGLVLEGISHVNRQLRDQFLITLGDKLHSINKELFLVISPFKQKGQDTGFNNKDFEKLSDHVDGFSLMTYDYRPDAPMNSPKIWCEDNLKLLLQNSQNSPQKSKKIYMGIPFYGYKSEINGKTDAIVGTQFIDILKENKSGSKKLKWNTDTHEHYYNFKDKKSGSEISLTYPSTLFLDERIQLAIKYKVSISIWEIGQGLDYFMDLL